jgi:hypothetical protein
MLTDRDIVVKVLAEGKDPATCLAGELAQGEAVTIGADDDAKEILHTMATHKVRRLPVIDGHTLIGMVAPWPRSPEPCPTPPSATCSTSSPPTERHRPPQRRSLAMRKAAPSTSRTSDKADPGPVRDKPGGCPSIGQVVSGIEAT